MPNRFKRKYYGSWDVFHTSHTRTELEGRRAQLAKVANSRILALERAKSSMTLESFYDAPHFDVVREYISNNTKGGRRFSESRNYKKSDFQLKQEITVLEEFLKMQTSTVGGSRRRESKIQESFREKGLSDNVTSSLEFWRFLNSETFKNLVSETLDSEDIIDIIEHASDDGATIEDITTTFYNWKGRTQKSLYQSFGLRPV